MSPVFLDGQTDKAALDQKLLRAKQFYATECVQACVCVWEKKRQGGGVSGMTGHVKLRRWIPQTADNTCQDLVACVAIALSGLRGRIPSTRTTSTQTLLTGQYLQNTINYQIRLEVAHGVFFQQEISPLPVPHLRRERTQKTPLATVSRSDERDIFNFKESYFSQFPDVWMYEEVKEKKPSRATINGKSLRDTSSCHSTLASL